MAVTELNHEELLALYPEQGTVVFAGQRAVILDAMAMGLLRKYLTDNFGLAAARTVLTQFGFAHGWRMAEALHAQFKWPTQEAWAEAAPRIHTLQGLFHVEPTSSGPLSKTGALLSASYEAEQHLLHFGRTDAPVCWTICGLISGYLSRIYDDHIYVLEDRCVGRGDAACHLFGRTREAWGDEHADELRFFDPTRLKDCLDVSLRRVIDSLRIAERKLRERRRALAETAPDTSVPVGFVAKSRSMRQVVDLARRVAKVDATVLITGETGSGKERIARLVHDESARAAAPFVAVNCGAIAETLLESELFGHVRGAFTGATQDRPGLFEAANNGTIFLDEVGDVPPSMQVKLLRTLQEREVRRVGENRPRPIDVRVLAATNIDLATAVAEGRFRRDLYYRLKVVELAVPPLRERQEDILPLARELLAHAELRMKRKLSGLTPGAADQLLRYPWPGNVRELENAMERAVALAQENRVHLEDLPEEIRSTSVRVIRTDGLVRPLEEVEREYILAVLELNGGNQTRTAEQLCIGSTTLYRKLKRYGALLGKASPRLDVPKSPA